MLATTSPHSSSTIHHIRKRCGCNDSATNLLIFITAKTVNADGASPEEVFDPRSVAAVGMSREDLPGYRAPKGADVFAPPPPPAKK